MEKEYDKDVDANVEACIESLVDCVVEKRLFDLYGPSKLQKKKKENDEEGKLTNRINNHLNKIGVERGMLRATHNKRHVGPMNSPILLIDCDKFFSSFS